MEDWLLFQRWRNDWVRDEVMWKAWQEYSNELDTIEPPASELMQKDRYLMHAVNLDIDDHFQ